MYKTMKELLIQANQENYAIIAGNCYNFETLRALINAAEEEKSPLIIDIAEDHIREYIKGDYLITAAKSMAERTKVPVAINLDHGHSFDIIMHAIKWGFSSVMIDASIYPLEENINKTKEIVKIAHTLGITVEAEIGHVGQGSEYVEKDPCKLYTDPKEAKYFVESTGVDALAVAVGTAHGEYKGTPKIDFARLKEIKDMLKMPLVLHGGSGTGDENLRKAVECGINKVNVFTDLMLNARTEINKKITENSKTMPIEITSILENGAKEKAKHYMRLFGSSNRA